jgi:ATP-binding cassette subfamily B protein
MKLKFCKQLDAMDCGLSYLKMVASYYGKDYSLNMLRVKSLMGKDGVSLRGISKAAEYLGFKTVGGRFTIKQLIEKKWFAGLWEAAKAVNLPFEFSNA